MYIYIYMNVYIYIYIYTEKDTEKEKERLNIDRFGRSQRRFGVPKASQPASPAGQPAKARQPTGQPASQPAKTNSSKFDTIPDFTEISQKSKKICRPRMVHSRYKRRPPITSFWAFTGGGHDR